jgi:diaminopropionate ammonia-lyase
VQGRAELRARLGLDASSRVLLVGSEGDTDPEIYRRIVGKSAEDVLA